MNTVPPVEIREAQPDDAAELARLSRALAVHVADPDPGDDTSLIVAACFGTERWLDVLVAEQGGVILGLAAYGRRFELHTRQKTLWLADLVVDEGIRGLGIGGLLLQAVKRRALDLGCGAIVADLWVCNIAARVFYDHAGARKVSDIEIRVIDLPSV